ncbi:MAG: hypothetical protein ACKVPX_16920 [Myxococcaceae bacterium]
MVRRFFPLLLVVLAACPRPDPDPYDPGASLDTDAEGFCSPGPPVFTEEVSACVALNTDYRPRDGNSGSDSWPACVSDGNTYVRVNNSTSTIARIDAFEQMAPLLWERREVPSPDDFVAARVLYAQNEGLDSRMQRREDIHYPEAPGGLRCRDPGVPDQYPDRCVGPAKLLPILNDAFAKGIAGDEPLVQAARIEAALVWFLYVSTLSEVTSCATNAPDCDSAWAYYTGGTVRESPRGLGRYIQALGAETHDRVFDGILAARCWRDLHPETPAGGLGLRNQARDQVDVALLRGVVLLFRQRLTEISCTDKGVGDARFAFLKVLAPLLARGAEANAPSAAEALRVAVDVDTPQQVQVSAAARAVDALFPCP